MHKFSDFFLDIAKVVIIALIIIIPIRFFIVQPFFVRGASMEPTYSQGDYLLIDEISYRFSEPARGDVIIFHPPVERSQFFIKRIIGLPGESVRIENGSVTIVNKEAPQGIILHEDYLAENTSGTSEITLGQEEYFALGDNRSSSFDSRSWGALKRDLILGKAFLRAWPFNNFDFIADVEYKF